MKLSKQEENAIFAEWAETKNNNLLQIIICNNISFLKKLSRFYAGKNKHLRKDLFQQSIISFISNLYRFEVNDKACIATYLSYWVKYDLLKYISKENKYCGLAEKDMLSDSWQEMTNNRIDAGHMVSKVNASATKLLNNYQRHLLRERLVCGKSIQKIARQQNKFPQSINKSIKDSIEKIRRDVKWEE